MNKKELPIGTQLDELGFETLFIDDTELITTVPPDYAAPKMIQAPNGVTYELEEHNQEDGEAYYRPVAARPRPTLKLIQGGRT